MPGPACPSCSYDLQAQITKWGARCPECGCGFTADELTPVGLWTRRLRPYLARWKWMLLAITVLPPLAFFGALCIGLSRYWDMAWPFWLEAAALGLLWGTPVIHPVIAYVLGRQTNPSLPWWMCIFIGPLLTVLSAAIFFLTLMIAGVLAFGCC